MDQAVKLNKGFTIIEVMVSIVIIMVVFIGLLQALIIYTKHNIANTIKVESIKVVQNCIENLRNQITCNSLKIRDFRNFKITYVIKAPDPDNFTTSVNRVTVTLGYYYPKNKPGYCLNNTNISCIKNNDCPVSDYCVNHFYIFKTVVYK